MIARNVTFGMASNEGSPGEIDLVVCLKTGPFEEEMAGAVGETRKGKARKAVQGTAVKVLGIVEVGWAM